MRASPAPEVVTLGCRLNLAESETIRGMIVGREMVVVNTCGVTNAAVKQSRAVIRRLRRLHPAAELVVTGCAAEMEPGAFAAMPEVDRIVANAAKLRRASWGGLVNRAPPRRHARAFVSVQTGCDHHCTFCAIPAGRGASRSDEASDVVLRIAALVETGHREVVLSGVDLTSYLDRGATLGTLVRRILREVPRLERLRLSSLDPIEIDDELFELLTQEPRMMPHVHLSMQAGDDLVLKRMRRRHSRADAVGLVARLKAARAEIAIGADLIAGFPTEDAAMFARTLALIDDADIVHAHVFPYSPRASTPAARMPQVDTATVRERAARLREAAALRKQAWLAGMVGSVQAVLIEKPGDRGHVPGFAELRISPLPVRAEHAEARVEGGTRETRPSTGSGRTEVGEIRSVLVTAVDSEMLIGVLA